MCTRIDHRKDREQDTACLWPKDTIPRRLWCARCDDMLSCLETLYRTLREATEVSGRETFGVYNGIFFEAILESPNVIATITKGE